MNSENMTDTGYAHSDRRKDVADALGYDSGNYSWSFLLDSIRNLVSCVNEIAYAKDTDSVGEAGSMPGTDGFTIACFKSADVPLGTKLYKHPSRLNIVTDTPRVPYYALKCIQEYGDARADDDGTSPDRLGETIFALRLWASLLTNSSE